MPKSRRRSRLHATTLAALVVSALPVLAFTAPVGAAAPAASAAPATVWTASKAKPAASKDGHRRTVHPASYQGYTLDESALRAALATAPMEDTAAARRGAASIEVPAPTGELIEFAVVESPILEDGLAAAHPEISTYAGSSVTEGYDASIRLDLTPLGFHASVRGGGTSWFVDPAYIGDTSLYLTYFGSALPAREKPLVEPELDRTTKQQVRRGTRADQQVGEGANGAVVRRDYRLALVTDPSYAEHFGATGVSEATSNSLVLAAKTTLMNRVNQIYGDDLAVRMLLVNGTDKLNFQTLAEATGTNGPCGALACYPASDMQGCGNVIDTNTVVLGYLIGAENYDIGHIGFGAAGDGGGVAYLGAVGMDSIKGGGCTGLNPPTGDFFAIDFVAHEMGHQFNGEHTFNGTQGSCSGGNRNAATSVEPGSGSSVMAYAGICGRDDLQPHTDPYFSQRTQTEVTAFVTAAPLSFNEDQRFGLSQFDGTDGFTLSFPGIGTTAAITNGSTYTAAGIKAAVEAVLGGTVSASSVSVSGFRLTYSGALAGTNIVNPTVVPTVPGSFTAVGGDYVKGGPSTNRGTEVTTANHNPTVTAPAARTIPIRTPFTLTGSATDTDGDALVYLWEQNNAGAVTGTQLTSNAKPSGPLFRVFGTYADVSAEDTVLYNSPGENLATSSPSRTFPDMDQVLANQTNAEGLGTCPTPPAGSAALPDGAILECYSEFLPTTARTMDFRLTARDQAAGGGGTHFGDVAITVSPLGPFLVAVPNSAVTWAGNGTQDVTWTSGMSSLAANVKISLSTDGGQTWPTVLAASTPNDGAQTVTIPNVATTQARIKVEAVDNYFFDVGNTDFTITASSGGLQVTQPGNPTQSVQYSDAIDTVSLSATTDRPAGVLAASVDAGTPLPSGLSLSPRSGTDASASWTVTGTADVAPGSYPVTVEVTDGTQTVDVPLTVTVTQENATPSYTGPTTQTADPGAATAEVDLTATVAQAADGSLGDLATATATFTDTTTDTTLCAAPVSSAGETGCSFTADVPRTYQVEVTVGGRFTGATAADTTLTVSSAPTAEVPETQLTGSPGQWLLGTVATYAFGSSLAGSTFACVFDGAAAPCTSPTVKGGLAAGTHVFTVAASKDGRTDATPARSVTTVPVDDAALKAKPGTWKRKKAATSFLGTYSTAKRKGAVLKYRVRDARALALVASTSPRAGKVKIYLGRTLITKVNLKGAKRSQVVVDLGTFLGPTSGRLRIVTASKRPVRIDGLGVASTL